MNDNVILILSKFLQFQEYESLCITNKSNNLILFNNIPLYIKKEYAISNLKEYPIKLLELFDPIKLFKTPIYKIKKYGWGDYIDFLNVSNFNNTNFIRGIDKYDRAFISILFSKENKIITTLFQRYTGDKYRWVSGGNTPHSTIVVDFDRYYKESNDIKFLIDFFNKNNKN
jgi:hypothetical protein